MRTNSCAIKVLHQSLDGAGGFLWPTTGNALLTLSGVFFCPATADSWFHIKIDDKGISLLRRSIKTG
jgi:hypothetical protein